jgi:hypothetical protein
LQALQRAPHCQPGWKNIQRQEDAERLILTISRKKVGWYNTSSNTIFIQEIQWGRQVARRKEHIGEFGYIYEQEIEENQLMEEILAKSEDELDFLVGSGGDILQVW